MKKIFTLVLLAAGTMSIATAESKNSYDKNNRNEIKAMGSDYNHQQDFDKNKSVAYNASYFSFKEKEAQIQRLNREFDQKIASVKMNRYLRKGEKNKQIRMLENQRNNEIAQVQYRFDKSNHHDVGFEKNKNHKW